MPKFSFISTQALASEGLGRRPATGVLGVVGLTAPLLALVTAAHAWTAEELRARLDEVQEQRALRIHPSAPTASDADLKAAVAVVLSSK